MLPNAMMTDPPSKLLSSLKVSGTPILKHPFINIVHLLGSRKRAGIFFYIHCYQRYPLYVLIR